MFIFVVFDLVIRY